MKNKLTGYANLLELSSQVPTNCLLLMVCTILKMGYLDEDICLNL